MSDQRHAPRNIPDVSNQRSSAVSSAREAPKVLVVDDDPSILLLMRETLSNSGFDVAVASAGREAIDICPAFAPDLVLLDINMPGMDGIEACAEIRQQSKRDFPIVMVTSVDDAVSIQRAFAAGASDFIVKPVNWPLFQRRLDQILDEWRRLRKFNERNVQLRLLEKVAPERVMLVSRSGRIMEDLKHRADSRASQELQYDTLEDLYGSEIARRFKQRISGVLKTSSNNTLRFVVHEHGVTTDYEAQFLVDGRDRVIVVVQYAGAETRARDEMYDLAYYDSASDLPNKHLFDKSANEALIDAKLREGPLTFVCVSFDEFTELDQLDRESLLTIARRLFDGFSNCLPLVHLGAEGSPVPVARVESNQFMFILQGTVPEHDLRAVCETIAGGFAAPVDVGPPIPKISPRMGVARFPADGADCKEIVHAARSAMLEACEKCDVVCFNSLTASNDDVDMLDYGNELRQAMDNGQLDLHYQPRISLKTGEVICVEALLRWNHPMRGFVDPAELLYLAKATGLIAELGDWVLQKACEEAERWTSSPAPRVSVNLSKQEFMRQDLAGRVIEMLTRTGLAPDRLELEITESALLGHQNGLADLNALQDAGVEIALDDFGTGLSSLSSLKTYPISALKIDSSFVSTLTGDSDDQAICEVIITIADKLNMKSVAEGVETEEQLAFLRDRGCDEAQGFHICKPLPANEIQDFLSAPCNGGG